MRPTAVSIGRSAGVPGMASTEHDRGSGKDEQGERVTEPPGQAVLDDVADFAAARGSARYRRDMVGFERVLQSEHKPQPQVRTCYLPRSADGKANFTPVGCAHKPRIRSTTSRLQTETKGGQEAAFVLLIEGIRFSA